MSKLPGLAMRLVSYGLTFLMFTAAVYAQGIPEDRNINIIGINPPTAQDGVPDPGLKQQNEPACAMKPGNPLQILCAFNDYRGVDDPLIGDAWEGYSYSINGGQTWFSDLLPAHPGDEQNLGLDFAADPQVVAAPGLALISYIAADRSENAVGGLFLQRMFEVNREAGAPWVPAAMPLEVDRGSADKFIDKPFMLLHPAPAGSGTVTVSSTLKDGTPISQEVPAATIYIAYTTFSGTVEDENLFSKILIAKSENYGDTWTSSEIANSSCQMPGQGHCKDNGKGHDKGKGNGHQKRKDLIQSASLAAYGDNVCAVWRRFADNDDPNAIVASCSIDRGETFAPPLVISAEPEFFPFDQGTTEATFRTNSYPVITTDGTRYYAFWASRINTISPFFARIVYSTSTDGSSWTAPVILENPLNGHQFMPSVATARGTIQLAWYDTRNNLFQADFVQDLPGEGVIPAEDSDKIIRNQADIRTAQIINGTPTPSVQVSRYVEGALEVDGPVEQLEFNFINDRLFKKGTVPFAGDYPNVAAPTFRVEDNQWVSNITPADSIKPVDFLVTWSDNRDVRGNVWEDLVTPTVYTPADTMAAMAAIDAKKVDTKAVSEPGVHDADNALVSDEQQLAGSDANITSNQARADAEPDETDDYGICVPGTNADRSRNQNVYSSVVRPGVSIDSPSSSKPTGAIQRSNVVWVSNNEDTAKTYTLTIDNQPVDAGINGRASFLQVPVAPFADNTGLLTQITVDLDPNSTVARTVYITSQTPKPEISVSISDGGSLVFGTVTLNGDILSPDVQNPDVQNPDVQNPDVQNPDIQNAEVHNPDVQNVVITRVQNPDVQNPDVQNPDVQNPDVQNPDVQNPDVQNPDIQNPDVQNTTLQAFNLDNPDVANDTLTPAEKEQGYTDVTYEVSNSGNTTTSFDLDAFINGETAGLKTQLIATRTHVVETSQDCVQGKLVQNQVIFNKINPDLDIFTNDSNDGVFGDGSAYIAPGETIFVTLRVWGDPDLFEAERAGVYIEAQSCNSVDKTAGTIDCDPPTAQFGRPASSFDSDGDGWAIANDGGGWVAAGGNPDGYIEGVDTGAATGSTAWYFSAPPKFLGDRSAYLGGELRYDLQQSDAAPGFLSQPWVVLRGAGITLVYDASVAPGTTWTPYAIPLETDAGWHIAVDGCWTLSIVSPNVCNFNGASPSVAQFMTVLSNLDTVLIRGEYSATFDTGGLDNAEFVLPVSIISVDTDILNDGTLIVANNLGNAPSAQTVNGVAFGINQGGLTGAWGAGGGDFSVDPFSAELDALLSNLVFSGTLGPVNLTIGGLVPGREYRLQLLFSNDVNLTGDNIAVSLEGKTYVLDGWQNNAINLKTEFTATGTSVVVTFQPGPTFVAGQFPGDEPGRAVLNAYALHELDF